VAHDLRAGDDHLQYRYFYPDGRPATTAPSHTINVWDVVGDTRLVKDLEQTNRLPPLSRRHLEGIPAKMYLPNKHEPNRHGICTLASAPVNSIGLEAEYE